MSKIYIDNQPFEADATKNLLHVALSLGFDLPYFCWHPALGSVGACRQCAVKQFKDEKDTQGAIVMACMVPAADGTRISIADPEARAFRKSVIEWLMTNHPHDCPICDEGGECHLQDMTVMTGHAYRRFRFQKRTFRNQYLGPFINHEMNRCIQCYRCVRFYKDYAGGHDLDAFAAHNYVYFGRHEDGVLENEFSGNLVEVCPTGVFTDKTLKLHYTRKWDLQTAPSICAHCGLGCNTIAGERYGQLRRILNRYHSQINGYFLCDRGRFGYELVNHPNRIRQPLLRHEVASSGGNSGVNPRAEEAGKANGFTQRSKAEILNHFAPSLADRDKLIGIGSPRASLEANFALRSLVGRERFFSGLSDNESALAAEMVRILQTGPARTASLRDVEQADAVLILGEDVTNTAPRMALALRQAVRNQPLKAVDQLKIARWHDKAARDVMQQNKGPLFIAFPGPTRLDEVATETFRAAPDNLARLGFAVAHAIQSGAPEPKELDDQIRTLAQSIAQALQGAEHPLVIAGASLGSMHLIHAAANVSLALCKAGRPASLAFVVPEPNTMGTVLLGGGELSAAVEAVESGGADTVIILENDLYRRAPAEQVDRLFKSAKRVIALDHLLNATTSRSGAVLPAGTFAESDGTFVNNEGRAQRFFQVFPPVEPVQESWRWICDLMRIANPPPPTAKRGKSPTREFPNWQCLDDVLAAMAREIPELKSIVDAAPSSRFRLAQQKFPRAPRRYSGRTAISAHHDVHEPKPPSDADTPLTFSMEGFAAQPPAALVTHYWAPGWNSVQSLNKFQSEVGGPLRDGEPGVRLFKPGAASEVNWLSEVPPDFVPRDEELLVVPLHHIFGSEELSVLSAGIAERSPQPHVAMNVNESQKRNLAPGDTVAIQLGRREHRLVLKVVPEMPDGVAGLPVGLPGLSGFTLPDWGRLSS